MNKPNETYQDVAEDMKALVTQVLEQNRYDKEHTLEDKGES